MRFASVGGALVLALATPALGQTVPQCAGGTCQLAVTPPQLLAATQRLVGQGHYREAQPLVDALRLAPGYKLQTEFLSGLIASRLGRYGEAVDRFKQVLAEDPRQTGVRLELADALMKLKQTASADRQLHIAEQDRDLPQEVARTIRAARDTIRSARAWRLDVNVGIAPDTNINNATSAQAVTILLGGTPLQASLNDDARARSGTGETGQLSAGMRLPVSHSVSALAELDATGTNYSGGRYDDYFVQGAGGAEYRLNPLASLSLEGVYAERWYGGRAIQQQFGGRGGGQAVVGKHDRIGVQVDLRHSRAFFDSGYSGWQGGLYATVEHALGKAMVLSGGPYVRREWLHADAYSNTEVGGTVGVGGELRYGFNVGLSAGVSRAIYDAALPVFDAHARRDTRFIARATLGNRKIRVWGFSPQVNWTYNRIDSSLGLYAIKRSRFEFTLARYF